MARQQHVTKPASTQSFELEHELSVVYKATANTQNGIVITDHGDPDEPIIYCNNAFVELSGYAREEIIGQNCRFLQGEDRDQPGIAILRQALSAGEATIVELRNYRKDGAPFWNELTISPIRDTDGTITHFVGIQNDISRRREAEQALSEERDLLESRVKERTRELQDMNDRLRRSNAELQDFAYVASHDLQEPLRKIQAFSNLLTQEYGSSVEGDGGIYLDRIQNAAERMRTLINDLLSYSRISTKPSEAKSLELDHVIEDVLIDMETSLKDSRADIQVDVSHSIEADASQMRQLFQNLITNAVKFRKPEMAPEVRITSKLDGDMVIISVQDNGIGIDQQYHDRIFTIFQRLHGKESYSGTGIGLAVVRKIVERHSGNIKVISGLGSGTTFEIRLPVKDER